MDTNWFETFSNREYWNILVEEYITTGHASGKTPISFIADLWQYFKFCLATENRFFFHHPLLGKIKEKILEHEISLPANSTIYRARIDSDRRLKERADSLSQLEIFQMECFKKSLSPEGQLLVQKHTDRITNSDGYSEYEKQNKEGFEGFDASGSGVPPVSRASAGRCNPRNVALLYAAKEMHTAVAEVRPYITDTVSIASIATVKELRLIDFYTDVSEDGVIYDWLYWAISSEFSFVNKGNENEYFATQYLTMPIKEMGFDGIQFKSSLVHNGLNYVIFDAKSCRVLSSKLYSIPHVHYELFPVSTTSHLTDAT